MPAWVIALLGGLLGVTDSLVGRVLTLLGFSFITYVGVDTGLAEIKSYVIGNLLNLPPEILAIVGLLQVGKSISIIFSAYAARMALDGLTGGGKKLIQGSA